MFSSMSSREETWREKMDTWDTGTAPGLSSPLILAVPRAWPQSCSESTLTPSLDQGSHLCRTQTTKHPLPSPCRTGEGRVVVPLCGHRADGWIPALPSDLLSRDLPRLSSGSQRQVSAVHTSWCPLSVKFKAWTVTQNTPWHGPSPWNNQGLWPQRGSDIKAQSGAHKHTGYPHYQVMGPWRPSTITSSGYCQTYRFSLWGISSGTSIPRMR